MRGRFGGIRVELGGFLEYYWSMDSKELVKLMKHIDKRFEEQEGRVREIVREEFDDVYCKIDKIVGALKDERDERVAQGAGVERRIDEVEVRVEKLELATA